MKPTFTLVLVRVKLGLDLELGPDLLPAIRGGCFLISTRCLVHSLAIVEAIVLLVAIGKVAVLEVVVAIVATTSDAIVIVASASLTVVDVKVHLSTKVSTL